AERLPRGAVAAQRLFNRFDEQFHGCEAGPACSASVELYLSIPCAATKSLPGEAFPSFITNDRLMKSYDPTGKTRITRDDLVVGLRALGIGPGWALQVHS